MALRTKRSQLLHASRVFLGPTRCFAALHCAYLSQTSSNTTETIRVCHACSHVLLTMCEHGHLHMIVRDTDKTDDRTLRYVALIDGHHDGNTERDSGSLDTQVAPPLYPEPIYGVSQTWHVCLRSKVAPRQITCCEDPSIFPRPYSCS